MSTPEIQAQLSDIAERAKKNNTERALLTAEFADLIRIPGNIKEAADRIISHETASDLGGDIWCDNTGAYHFWLPSNC